MLVEFLGKSYQGKHIIKLAMGAHKYIGADSADGHCFDNSEVN